MTEATLASEERSAVLARRYQAIRDHSTAIAARLFPEDCVIQSMPDASPVRWHLAHTTWFFETFLLRKSDDYEPVDPAFAYLFNSYYNTIGDQYPRHRRGLLSRPTVAEVHEYRQSIDETVQSRIESHALDDGDLRTIEIGLQHEQQHQELMLTDVKHLLSCNPLGPAMFEKAVPDQKAIEGARWLEFESGLREIGHAGKEFCYDNELPRHHVFVHPFRLSSRLVTNGEYLQFIEDGGYRDAGHWLSAGWSAVQEDGWTHPIYWIQDDGKWLEFTLGGFRPLDRNAPVSHVSYYEADAFARWSGNRLPTEAEWEIAAEGIESAGSGSEDYFARESPVHPTAGDDGDELRDLYGCVWQWTSSQYTAYPGYKVPPGAIGEYNGKFMCNQFVLRGSSCATPRDHARVSYRNFFPPDARWQFTGIRLANDDVS